MTRADREGRFWLARVGGLAAVLALTAAGAIHLVSGIASERAFPVPVYLLMGVPQSPSAYAAASHALAAANVHDGAASLARAEAAQQLGVPSAEVNRLRIAGLRQDPASVRGWTLLAESQTDPGLAAQAEGLALEQSPNQFWLAERRVAIAARLWQDLDPAAQAAAQVQARQLWEDPALRPGILLLLQTQAGADLLTRAYQPEPATLRQLNAWVSDQRLAGG